MKRRGRCEIGKRPEGENDHCSGDERVGSWQTERERVQRRRDEEEE